MIEDNCESMGSRTNKKNLGTFGIASSHSFYYGHHISTIEGGMVSTNDKKFHWLLDHMDGREILKKVLKIN